MQRRSNVLIFISLSFPRSPDPSRAKAKTEAAVALDHTFFKFVE
jgi:hypothetical protein